MNHLLPVLIIHLSSDIDDNMDPYGQQENDEVSYYLTEDIDHSKSETFEKLAVHLPDVGNNDLIKSISD